MRVKASVTLRPTTMALPCAYRHCLVIYRLCPFALERRERFVLSPALHHSPPRQVTALLLSRNVHWPFTLVVGFKR